MATELYGHPLGDALARLGALSQAITVESSTRSDGPDAGTRRIRVNNGVLDIELLPDRGLDIAQVRAGGIPLAWLSGTGFPPLSAGDVDGRGWLRAFGGGLLTTCGLLNVGPAGFHEGEWHPMHGRYSSLRAQVTRAEVTDTELVVEGVVSETTVFGAHLQLRRRIGVPIGDSVIHVEDVILNRGAREVEPMVLYHVNLGWPVIDEGTRLRSPAVEVTARDAAAEAGLASWDLFPGLQDHYPEQVFTHRLPEAQDVEVAVVSPNGLGVRVAFDSTALPGLFQWRVAERGHYVLGVEPATVSTIHGRAVAAERGLLRPLAPGASLHLGLRMTADLPGR